MKRLAATKPTLLTLLVLLGLAAGSMALAAGRDAARVDPAAGANGASGPTPTGPAVATPVDETCAPGG